MEIYYKLIKSYPNSAELGTIFYTYSESITPCVFSYDSLSLEPNLIEDDLTDEFFEKSIRLSEDGFPLFEGDIVTIMNQVMFTHPSSYNDNAKFYKFATNIKSNE